MSELTDALLKAQAELPTAVKHDSQGYGYRYAGLPRLMELRSILNKHGITFSQEPSYCIVGDTLRPILVTRVCCGDDEHEFCTPLYVEDPKTSQAFGSAVTYSRRYAMASFLGIASEEDTDGTTADDEDVPF